jgi:hypothetical protein
MLKYIPKTKTITKAIEIDNYEAPYSLEWREIITWPSNPITLTEPQKPAEETKPDIENEKQNYEKKNWKKIKELEDEVQEWETEIITGNLSSNQKQDE